MNDILNIGVAQSPKRLLEVTKIDKQIVTTNSGKVLDKIILETVEQSTGKTFTISDSWIEDPDGSKRVKGLWFSLVEGELNKSSTLARVLTFYEAHIIGDLMGREIVAYPDKNDYLVLTACEMSNTR